MEHASLSANREILFEQIVDALGRMPGDLEEIFVLTHYEGKTSQELATRFKLPLSELTARIKKADRIFYSHLRNS